MLKVKSGQKVVLVIGGTKFQRTVSEVDGHAIYLMEGGDAFDARTGLVWGTSKRTKQLFAK